MTTIFIINNKITKIININTVMTIKRIVNQDNIIIIMMIRRSRRSSS